MPDKFSLEGEGLEPEASLDDFFQPSTEPAKGGAGKPAKVSPADTRLPVDRDKPVPAETPEPPQLEVPETEPGPGKKEGGLLSNKLLLILIGVLVLAVIGAGSFFAYSMFFGTKSEEVASAPPPAKPKAKPAPEVQPPETAAKPEQTAAPSAEGKPQAPAKPEKKKKEEPAVPPTPLKPEKTPAKAKADTVPPTGAKETAAKLPETKKTVSPPPVKPAAAKTAPQSVLAGVGPYRIQVGAYALAESQVKPLNRLKELGLTDYNFVPREQKVLLYHVAVGKALDKAPAEALSRQLTELGFAPRLEPDGNGFQVIAYSYGNRRDADRAKSKIERAGLGRVSIQSSRRTMTLQQLRVGHFTSRAEAQTTLTRLRQAGFQPVLVREL